MSDAAGAFSGGLGRDQHDDPGATRPGLLDVIEGFLGPDCPTGVTPVTFLVSRCGERDLAFALELVGDLATEREMVGFDGQGDVGARLEAPAKNACVVWRASAWISFP